MSLLKSADFIADVELQFGWYEANGGWEVADRYLNAIEVTCNLLGRHPQLGPSGNFRHLRLRDWRFFIVRRPFNEHVLFYEHTGEDVIFRRTMRGQRNLPRRLLDPPGAE
jgi:plasmid stabilization system protein ParE